MPGFHVISFLLMFSGQILVVFSFSLIPAKCITHSFLFLSLILSLWPLGDEYKLWAITLQRQLVTVLSLGRLGFIPRLVRVGFMVKRIMLGQVFIHVLQFCHQCLSINALYLFIHFVHSFIPSSIHPSIHSTIPSSLCLSPKLCNLWQHC